MTPSIMRSNVGVAVAVLAVLALAPLRLALATSPGYVLDLLIALGAAVGVQVASRRATRARSLRSWHMQRASALVWAIAPLALLCGAPDEVAGLVRLAAVGCTATAWWLASYSGDAWSRVRMAIDGGVAVGSVFVVTWAIGLDDAWEYTGGGFAGTLALSIPLATVAVALFAGAVGLTEFRGRHRWMPFLFVVGLVVLAYSDVAYACGRTPLWAVGWGLWILATIAYRGTSGRSEVVSTRQRFAYAPYVFVAPAAIAMAATHQLDRVAAPVAVAGAVMVVLLLVRQHVTLVENSVLVDRLAVTERLLRHQATHDHLTGLAGRVVLWERLALVRSQAADAESTVALLFVDLDNFKQVNDQHGHATGDHVLVETAQRIRHVLEPYGDQALGVRMSGDEFAVLLTGEAAGHSAAVAHDILDDVMRPIGVNDIELSVGASVGVATAVASTVNPSALLRSADEAMYVIKHHGKGGVEVAVESAVDHDPLEEPTPM